MRRVLFVDDEPNILEGLRNRLRRQRNKWEMQFVQSGNKALEILATEPIDVIVSDMRMPEMDGATLLRRVKDQFPHVVRIVLSGHAELDTALRAVPVAHQFLAKPCEPGVIEEVVERACNLQSLMNEEVVKRIVGKIDRLPSLPRIYSQLVATLSNESVSADDIAEILKQDMAMCAKLLQIVNSAFFRLSCTISKIEQAVTYLGFNTIKQVVLSVEVFQFSSENSRSKLSLDDLQTHALAVGHLASGLFENNLQKDDAFVAGLLHDIGKLVLTVESPGYIDETLLEMRNKGCPMYVAEERLWGVTHAEIGGYLLGLWGLPYPIVEAVANHHAPSRVDANEFGILASTHIANGLIQSEMSAIEQGKKRVADTLDSTFLERLGLIDKLDAWRELARRQIQAGIKRN